MYQFWEHKLQASQSRKIEEQQHDLHQMQLDRDNLWEECDDMQDDRDNLVAKLQAVKTLQVGC